MAQTVEVLHTGFITHDVKQIITTRPDRLDFEPGQGVELSLDREGWREEGRPLTPTSRTDEPVLEFTIKEYPEHDGVTTRLHGLKAREKLLVSDAFGTITSKGPGTFIAGGAGVTPFLAIFRHMSTDELAGTTLLFSNRTPADVICERELRHLLGDRCHLTCTARSGEGYDDRRIDQSYIQERIGGIDQPFYLCGPRKFVDDIRDALVALGAARARIVTEE